MTEVIGATAVATRPRHVVEPRGAQARILGQGLLDQRHEPIGHRRASGVQTGDLSGLRQYAAHGGVMHAQLACDGARLPVLGVMEA